MSVSRRATLIDGTRASPCLIQDFSTGGFFILTNQQYASGQIVELKCELYPDQVLQCKVEVRHISETCIGTKISEITPTGTALLRQFLQEYYSLKLNQST